MKSVKIIIDVPKWDISLAYPNPTTQFKITPPYIEVQCDCWECFTFNSSNWKWEMNIWKEADIILTCSCWKEYDLYKEARYLLNNNK